MFIRDLRNACYIADIWQSLHARHRYHWNLHASQISLSVTYVHHSYHYNTNLNNTNEVLHCSVGVTMLRFLDNSPTPSNNFPMDKIFTCGQFPPLTVPPSQLAPIAISPQTTSTTKKSGVVHGGTCPYQNLPRRSYISTGGLPYWGLYEGLSGNRCKCLNPSSSLPQISKMFIPESSVDQFSVEFPFWVVRTKGNILPTFWQEVSYKRKKKQTKKNTINNYYTKK